MDNRVIVLGGVGRSGTTILSKLIGSLADVEFFYEPKTVDALFAHVHDIARKEWNLLFERNLYEDLLINALAGRNINTNKNDDSSIYNYKPEKEILKRLEKSYGKLELDLIAKNKVIAFKLLNNILNSDKVEQYYPNLSCVFIIRNPNDTINSLLKKSWYSNEAMSVKSPKPSSLFEIYKDFRIPNFVKRKDFDLWINSSEIQRYCYYYDLMFTQMKPYTQKSNCTFIDYDDLIRNKERVLDQLLTKLNVTKGERTDEILNTIQFQQKKRVDLLQRVDETTSSKLMNQYNFFAKFTID